MKRISAWVVVLLWGFTGLAWGQAPFLRVDVGAHIAPILDVATDRDGRFVVSNGAEPILRVWDGRDGHLVSALRAPMTDSGGAASASQIDYLKAGLMNVMAMSPAGDMVACSGLADTAQARNVIDIFDPATGQMKMQIATNLKVAINSLCFVPQGTHIIVGTFSGAVGILRLSDRKFVAADTTSKSGIARVAIHPSSKYIATVSFDHVLRLYTPDLKPLGELPLKGGEDRTQSGLAFSPDGGRLAVTSGAGPFVEIVSVPDLKPVGHLQGVITPHTNGTVFDTVAWSSSGKSLYASGRLGPGFQAWTVSGQLMKPIMPDTSRASGLATLPGGRIAFGTQYGRCGAVRDDGSFAWVKGPGALDMGQQEFLVSDDGRTVQFGVGAKDYGWFSLDQRALGKGAASMHLNTTLRAIKDRAVGYARPRGGMVVGTKAEMAAGTLPVWIKGGALDAAMSADGAYVAFIMDGGSIHVFDGKAREIWANELGRAACVNFSKDGKLVIVTTQIGTVDWYRTDNGRRLLSLYVDPDFKRWAMWTTSGYYDASVGGQDLVGWQMPHGIAHAADFFPLSRFRQRYNRPDVVNAILTTLDEDAAVKLANEQAGRQGAGQGAKPLAGSLPPLVVITKPADSFETSASDIDLQYTVQTPKDAPVQEVKVTIDGRPVSASRDLKLVAEGEARTVKVSLPAMPNSQISVIAYNKYGASSASTIRVHRTSVAARGGDHKPNLYVLAVGVADYKDPSLKLKFGAKDAHDFVTALQQQKGKLYENVVVRELVDANASRNNIVTGLEWLEKQTTADDVAVLFVSGHGANDDNGDYCYLPFNFDQSSWRATSVPYTEFRNTVARLKGKALLFVDTCHSGNVLGHKNAVIDSITNEMSSDENGAVIFASSTGRQVSYEDATWGNGAFTCAVVEGLQGKAAYGEKSVTVNGLTLYVGRRVTEMTNGKQTPATARPNTVPDFPVASAVKAASNLVPMAHK